MKVIEIKDIFPVGVTGCSSYRFVTKSDMVGFSVNKTVIPKGGPNRWHYKHHLEACYCVSGLGKLTNLETGESFYIQPDTCYLLDNHDDHTFQALEDTVLISIFNPPLNGDEFHDKDGSYPMPEEMTKKDILARQIVQTVNVCNNDYDAIYQVKKLLQ